MTTTYTDRDIKELFERVAMLEKSVLAERACAESIQKVLDRLRGNVDLLGESHVHQTASLNDRLSIVEDRIFPNMGSMLDGVQKIIGRFSGWHRDNPLDRRQNEA